MNTDRHHDADEPEVPVRLVKALRQLPSERVFVPRSVDQSILSAARQRLDRPAARRPFLPRLLWPALAAAVVLLLWIGLLQSDNARFARNDLNRDGQVDIIDAFELARQLRDGRQLARSLDQNGDGVVDQRDVERIAAEAVALEKGDRS